MPVDARTKRGTARVVVDEGAGDDLARAEVDDVAAPRDERLGLALRGFSRLDFDHERELVATSRRGDPSGGCAAGIDQRAPGRAEHRAAIDAHREVADLSCRLSPVGLDEDAVERTRWSVVGAGSGARVVEERRRNARAARAPA